VDLSPISILPVLSKGIVEWSGFFVAVLLDFSKAFDSVVHGLLLWKLKVKFGLSSTACRLFGSFLGRRAQKVMADGEFSR
jgi:hypothetical protein